MVFKIINWLKRIALRVFLTRRISRRANEKEIKLIEQLRDDVKNLNFNQLSSVAWLENQKILRNSIMNSDPRNFTNWLVIQQTMFHYAKKIELIELKRSPNWDMLKKGIIEDKAGNPPKYHLYFSSSGNLIHHAYSLKQLLDKEEYFDIEKVNQIFEFGGGYGSFCRMIYKIGYKKYYSIYDLPIFNHLQKYFIKSIENNDMLSKINYVSDEIKIPDEIDFFISLWGISETPFKLRDKIFDKLNRTKYVLIAYQADYSGLNNVKYFSKICKNNLNFKWYDYEIPHLVGNRYLIGISK